MLRPFIVFIRTDDGIYLFFPVSFVENFMWGDFFADYVQKIENPHWPHKFEVFSNHLQRAIKIVL